jgi:hypothetical protein
MSHPRPSVDRKPQKTWHVGSISPLKDPGPRLLGVFAIAPTRFIKSLLVCSRIVEFVIIAAQHDPPS